MSYSTKIEAFLSIIVFFLFFILLFYLLKLTDSDVVVIDSFTTSLSLTAMLLLARRKVENWLYWIIADIIYVPLFIYKGLYITSIQYLVFLYLAIMGYREWKRKIK